MGKAEYDCYEDAWGKPRKLVCSGTLQEIAEFTGLKLATVKSYAYGPGGHKYDIVKSET